MARPKAKTAPKAAQAKSKAMKTESAAAPVQPKAKRSFLSRFAGRSFIHPQTMVLMFGVTLPLSLVWIGSWLMFTLPKLLEQVNQYLAQVSAAAPDIYAKVLIPIYGETGVGYTAIGIIVYVLALACVWIMFRNLRQEQLALGEIRAKSVAVTLVVFFIITAIVISLANKVLFDSLLALSA